MSELPKGWASTELANLFEFVLGGDWGEDTTFNGDDYVDVYCIRGTEFKLWNKEKGSSSVPRKIRRSSLDKRALEIGDILIEISGGGPDQPVGRTVLIDERAININKDYPKVCTNFIRLARPFSAVSSSYLNYYLRSFYLSGEVTKYQGGSNNLRNLKFKEYNQIQVPLAPLNEQISIADKLDSVLAKVDKAQARLEKIPGILKRFRQSVLAAATSGELTREWREKNGVSLSSWQDTIFSTLSREITVGFVGKMSDKYQDSGIKFLRSQNVRAFKFDPKNLLFISPEFHLEIYKSRLEAGDLAVVRSGAPGTTCVIPTDLGEANCSDLVIVRPNEKLVPDFGCIFMNSSVAHKNVKENQVGVAQQHFNVGSMKLMPINLPTRLEQAEIVRRVHSLFAMAEAVEKNYGDSLVRVKKLTQSILSKAFRGELVEQVSSDEPAEALLYNIQKTRESKSLSSSKAQASSIKNSLREKITVERKDVMNLANAPDNYLLGLLRQLG
ncbi:MAG: restriction endonuclease subunit S [Gammaproteobacteria bacterium]|nr:restriction endonuclease subunit S [Gammaproteobacteria bacterium]